MGGAFGLLRPEYNIQRDYIASSIVFGSGVPITAVGLDVTLRCKLEGADLERLRAAGNEASRFLVRLIELWQSGQAGQYPTLHDPLAMAVVFRAGLVETQLGRVEVETAGAVGNGLTLFTPADRLPKGITASTLIAREVNVRGFLDLLVGRCRRRPGESERRWRNSYPAWALGSAASRGSPSARPSGCGVGSPEPKRKAIQAEYEYGRECARQFAAQFSGKAPARSRKWWRRLGPGWQVP